MADPEVDAPQDPIPETTENPIVAEADVSEIEEVAPVICDPVIGFVCPSEALKRG